jgi:hypothetical protein
LIGLFSISLLDATVGPQAFVYTGSNDEVSCYEKGLIDGEDHQVSQQTYDKCGDDDYRGFV